jgi:two-component system chemotaxis response regulator CheB
MQVTDFSDEDIDVIIGLARQLTGTNLNKKDHSIVIYNVAARMEELELNQLDEYLAYIDDHADEMTHFISALTIHTTSWFREIGALRKFESFVDGWIRSREETPSRVLQTCNFQVLSVACSTGEEVYSIAAILEIFRRKHDWFDYSIEGWDIDPLSLRTARQGTFNSKSVATIPEEYRTALGFVKTATDGFSVSDHIKNRCKFKTANIVQVSKNDLEFDFVFCRNMLIYFEPIVVKKICLFLFSLLRKNGLICVGLSETSAMSQFKLKSLGLAVYEPSAEFERKPNVQLVNSVLVKLPMRVLVVDDEVELANLMEEILLLAGYKVDKAYDAEQGLEILRRRKTTLVLSDFQMPQKNGIEFYNEARKIGFKGDFVLISAHADRSIVEQSQLIGLSEVILKPCVGDELYRLVKSYDHDSKREEFKKPSIEKVDLIALGASTGGTEVLVRLLKDMPPNCPPIMIVQHIGVNFATDFGRRLASHSGLKLANATDQEEVVDGTIYLARGDYQMGVVKDRFGKLCIQLSNQPHVSGHRPSIDYLFDSIAESKRATFAALFTGMGRDGAAGLLNLRRNGAITFAQNEETCAVFGMPKEAIKLNAAAFVLSPEGIRSALFDVIAKKRQLKKSVI